MVFLQSWNMAHIAVRDLPLFGFAAICFRLSCYLEHGVCTQEKLRSENLAELTEVHGAFATLDVH